MKIEKLKELYISCRNLPNYQYKDLTEDQFQEKANKSISKLSKKHMDQVLKSWATCLGKTAKELTKDEMQEVARLRFLSQTNLFFLCHLLESYNQTTVKTHEDICNSFFVQKDPTFLTFEDFANQYKELKSRMLLVPRGGFKSSLNMADCIQWVLCFPAITILILTGVYDLAGDFVGEIKRHFTLEESGESDSKGKMGFGPRKIMDKKSGEWSESMFQVLFPEHCIRPSDGTMFEYQTPAEADKKEPSVRAASIEQALSGSHFDVLDLDDVVTNENSQTADRMLKINKQIEINKAMMHPYGFFNVIGTWYDECLVGDTLITMSDWSQKKIKDIRLGDEVVGFTHNPNERSMLVKTKVTHVFEPQYRKTYKYTFKSGLSVTSTDNHLWWKGSHGDGEPYRQIGIHYHKQKFVRRLLTPSLPKDSRESGYLAGLYDGEGSFQKNPEHPSGTITISQTQHNPEIVDSMRTSLDECGFEYTEYVSNPKNSSQKHEFKLLGGWKTRYKFLSEICPTRKDVIEDSLFGQNITEKDYVVSVEDTGVEELTYCFETETHNYVADGCCSHNCDFYGVTIKQEEQFAKDEGIIEGIYGSVDSGKFNSSVYCKVYLRAAWWPTEAAKKAGKIEDEMKEEDWELWFPERLTYKFLTTEKKTDKTGTTFAIKYLNDPRKMNKVKFPRELLIRRTITHNMIPPSGIVVTAIDTAYSTKQWADYTVIMTGLIFGGRFYIINMVRGKYNEFDLPKVIATTAYKWKPKRICIEESVGVRWFTKELRREMDQLQISVPVEYVSLGQGTKLRSKQMKAKPVLRLLGDERLFFVNSCEGLEEIYEEMERFTGTSSDIHDDIVSAISLLVEQYGGYADMDGRANYVMQDYTSNRKSEETHNMMYCLGKYARFNESGMTDDNPVTQFQVEKAQVGPVNEQYFDPLSDLYR